VFLSCFKEEGCRVRAIRKILNFENVVALGLNSVEEAVQAKYGYNHNDVVMQKNKAAGQRGTRSRINV
jgi:hypothetical protein